MFSSWYVYIYIERIVITIHRVYFSSKNAEFSLGQRICSENRILTNIRWPEVKIIWTWLDLNFFLVVFGKYHVKKLRLAFQNTIDYMLLHTTSELKLPGMTSLSASDRQWDHPNYVVPAETPGNHKYHTSWHRPDELFRWFAESWEILLMYFALNHYVLS